jgi:flagellar motor switch protein FliM
MLQARRWRVQFPMRSLNVFNLPHPSSLNMALGSTQPLTEQVLGIFLGGKGRPARKADNLTTICEPIVQKIWEPQRLTTLWASRAC